MTVLTDFGDNIISTLMGLGYQLKHDGTLTIARTTDGVAQHYIPASSSHGRLDLKGVIFEANEGERLVAPGCKVPLEQPNDELTVSHYSKGRDGILYRFYCHCDTWRYSTTGKINPNTYWGPKGTPSFNELCQEAIDAGLVDTSKLNPNYCYYAVLESPRYTNFVKHDKLSLTLIDCIDCSTPQLVQVPLDDDLGFRDHEQWLSVCPTLPTDTEPRPLTRDDMGYNVHYTDGSIFRHETEHSKLANDVRPNLPDPTQQWVQLLKDRREGFPMYLFLKFFPWNEQLFTRLDEKYQTLLHTVVENYKLLDQEGWRRVQVPSRHVNYMRDLMDEVTEDRDSEDLSRVIEKHLLDEDPKRLCFLINPYDALPRSKSEQTETAS